MKERQSRRWLVLIVASLCAAVGAVLCLVGLRALDYSRADLEFLDPEHVDELPPLASVGALSWETEPYENATSLEPLRAFVRSECPLIRDRDVVTCLVTVMAARFPHGDPGVEFFSPAYEPAAALESHLAGEPGHCVTRSGLISATLLATGIPARVVQLFPSSSVGHNLFSYFDRQEQRWTLIDPTYGVRVHQPGNSVASLIRNDGVLFDRIASPATGVDPDVEAIYRSAALLDGHALYPEPWLYTRVGPRIGHFPYTAHYVVIGAPTLSLGWGHRLYRAGMCSLALLSVLLAGAALLASRRRISARAVAQAETADVDAPPSVLSDAAE